MKVFLMAFFVQKNRCVVRENEFCCIGIVCAQRVCMKTLYGNIQNIEGIRVDLLW